MPTPGTAFVFASMSAYPPWPRDRSSATTCSFGTPAGRDLPMTPSKMTFIALPVIRGPTTFSATLIEPSATTTRIVMRSGRRRARSLRSVPRKSFERSTGADSPMNGLPPRCAIGGRPPAPRPCGRPIIIMPRPPRAVTRRSRGTPD